MHTVHIANASFENELTAESPYSLSAVWRKHKNFIQLSYLPLLYGSKQDFYFAEIDPPNDYINTLVNLGFNPPERLSLDLRLNSKYSLEAWGDTGLIKQFAALRHMHYNHPNLSLIKQLAAKTYSTAISPAGSGELLSSIEECSFWLKHTSGKRVIKSIYGFSGLGHFLIDKTTHSFEELPTKIRQFLLEEVVNFGRPVIGEFWVESILEFSTQWFIHKKGEVKNLGPTRLLSTKSGAYQANIAADNTFDLFGDYHDFYQEHLAYAKPILQKIQSEGFFGHLGLDAMLYKNGSQYILRPILEINPRKTMGLIAVCLNRRFKQKFLALRYLPKKQIKHIPLLPFSSNQMIFPRQLEMELDLQSIVH